MKAWKWPTRKSISEQRDQERKAAAKHHRQIAKRLKSK